jgi:hypothetical protein
MEKNHEQLNSPEKKEFPAGKYQVVASVHDYRNSEQITTVDGSAYLYGPGTLKDLEQKARSWAAGVGLHNFGMDAAYPVEFSVRDESGTELYSFSCKFNSSGYPADTMIE